MNDLDNLEKFVLLGSKRNSLEQNNVFQKFRETEKRMLIFQWPIPANGGNPHAEPQTKRRKPRFRPCEGLCAHPIGWVASVYLPKIETQCWSLCAPLSRETILPLKWQEQRRSNRRETGQSIQPPDGVFWP